MTVFSSLDGKVPRVQNLGTDDALFTRSLSPRHVLDADVVSNSGPRDWVEPSAGDNVSRVSML